MSGTGEESEARGSTRNVLSRRGFLSQASAAGLLASSVLWRAGRAYPQETGKTVRLAVVGGGFGATFHWHQHPNCKVTAVTDLRPERRKRLQEYYHCDMAYDSLEELLKREKELDAVAVFSGATDHADHVKQCMERGLHVVSACPACFTLEEAALLKEVKERTGRRYMMAESSYYRSACILARNLYKQGALGELFYSELEYYHDRGDLDELVTDKTSRFYMPDGSHSWRWGLPPMHYPTHSLAYLTGVTGERITKVAALGWGNSHPWLTDNAYNNPFWNEFALMKTDKGHMCRCNVFWVVAGGGERAQWFGDRATFAMERAGFHGDVLRFRTKEQTASMYDLPETKGGEIEVPEYWKTSEMLPDSMRHASGHGGSAVFISAEFINALIEEREPEIDLSDSLAMTVPGIVAHQSALKDGELLEVPAFDA